MACLWGLVGTTRAQTGKKPVTKSIDFKTYDGATLIGTFYPNPSGKKDATVILLHDPDLKRGGSSQQEGWADLAAALQADGYAVLMFDYRGFGESKTVTPDTFFDKHPHNRTLIRGGARKPTQISYKDFTPRYIPYLVNDIAAAKAYLDRQNDQKQCNTSSVILIGAGESAALGTLWMANEARRCKNKNTTPVNPLFPPAPVLAEPESKDLAAGIWLSASSRAGSASVPVRTFAKDLGRDQNVPMVFIYGDGDKQSATIAQNLAGPPRGAKDTSFPRSVPIKGSSSAGHRLLGRDEECEKVILATLRGIMEKRGSKEWVERKVETSQYWYTTAPRTSVPSRINKPNTEYVPGVTLGLFLQGY